MKAKHVIQRVSLVSVIFVALTLAYLNRVHKQSLDQQLADAIKYQDAETVRSLLAHGADPNGRSHDGKQMLEWLEIGQTGPTAHEIEIARMLVKGGVEPVTTAYRSGADERGPQRIETSHLYKFASFGDIEMMQIMLQRERKYPTALVDNREILISAVSGRQLSMLKFLLASGMKPDGGKTDRDRFYPLEIAAAMGWLEGVDLLLEYGANPNVKNDPGLTPLMAATGCSFDGHTEISRHFEIMKRLIAHGASVSQENNGQVALDYASVCGNTAMVSFLLDHGADVNHHDRDGLTPLAYAIDYGKANIVKLLLAHGADPHVVVLKKHGAPISLIEYAMRRHRPEIMLLLKSKKS